MARLYIAVNGDDVGNQIGNAIASNDHMALNKLSSSIKDSHSMVDQWVESKGGETITSSGDEGLYIIPEQALEELEDIRAKYEKMSGHTLTVGVGTSMADASKALIYGKLNEKNQVVYYEAAIDDILSDDQVDEAEQIAEEAGEDTATNLSQGQEKQVLNEEQINSTTPAKEPLDTGDTKDFSDPDDNIESANNEVGEPKDQDAFVDEDNADEYDKQDPDEMVGLVVDQESVNKEDSDNMQNDENFDENADGIEDEATIYVDGDDDGDIHAEDDALVGMVEEDMSDQKMPVEEDEEMMEKESENDEHADVKAAIMDTLQIFRAHKGDLDILATANPELHAGLISMLQNMIEMGKRLQISSQPNDIDELNQYFEEFPNAGEEDMEDIDEHQKMIEEEMDEHNEEMHGEDPDEDSAIEDDEDSERDATPDDSEDFYSEDSDDDYDDYDDEGTDEDYKNKNPFPPKKSDKGKLEKK